MSGPLSFDDEPETSGRRESTEPKPEVPPPAKPPGMSRYGWWLGVLVFLILVYIGVNTLNNSGGGSRGIAAGKTLPPFAVPLALSHLNGDANIATRSGEGASGQRPACSVRGPQVLNECQLVTGAPSAIAFLATRGGDCTKQLDVLERARARFPQVRFAAVAIRGNRNDLRSDIRSHGWQFPVGYDHDGAVANLYDVAVCPTVTFAYPGGTALRTTLGLLDTPKLDATLRELVAGSEKPGLEAAAMSEPSPGWVDAEVADEFPELRLIELPVGARPGRTPRSVQERLHYLSSRFRGAQAVAQRQQPVPWAYRVFYRHVGLDPDADRTPAERAMLGRLMHGGFKSENLLDDALLIALVETGVPIWALDAAKVDGTLGVRLALPDERLGRAEQAPPVPAGRLVVADAESPLAVLFGELAPGHGVTHDTEAMRLFSVQVAGVPSIHVEEALFQCSEILVEPR